jgi:peroxisomal membrane protein 4
MYLQATAHGGVEQPMDSFFAGLVGGTYIFGNDSAVVQQMNLYVFARVMQTLAKLAIKKGVVKDSRGVVVKYSWPVFGGLTWAMVMYLFRWYPELIQVTRRRCVCVLMAAEYAEFDEVLVCQFG